MVKENIVRFYAGTPIVSSRGHRLGTVCFASDKPRKFDAEGCTMLTNMGELVTSELEREWAAEQQAKSLNSKASVRCMFPYLIDNCIAPVGTQPQFSKVLVQSSTHQGRPCKRSLPLTEHALQSNWLVAHSLITFCEKVSLRHSTLMSWSSRGLTILAFSHQILQGFD